MKRFFLLVALFFATVSAFAQSYRELIKDNPAMAAANLMNYHFEQSDMTPAPKGYKAFYISHYGRHGSRYDASDVNAAYIWPIMKKAEKMDLFTAEGKAFWKELKLFFKEQDEMYGMLTSLGAEEQRGIGERMANNFPDVFKGKDGRDKVMCQSSIVPRCILSMTNCIHALDRSTDNVDFEYVTGDRYMEYLSYRPKSGAAKKMAGTKELDVRRETMKPLELIEYIFNDSSKALELIDDPFVFEQRLYLAASPGHLSDHGVCLLAHFPYEILVRNFEVRNPRFYLAYGMSNEMSEYQKQVSRRLLADFLKRAEEAMNKDSDVAADLRFGHDTALLPLVGHIRIEGMDNWLAFDEVNKVWNSSNSICMASNLQMVFYRNKKGDVLVKLLYNEKETTIPSLGTYIGPYYRWDDLHKYLKSLL